MSKIIIAQHPSEIIEVNDETINSMKKRLATKERVQSEKYWNIYEDCFDYLEGVSSKKGEDFDSWAVEIYKADSTRKLRALVANLPKICTVSQKARAQLLASVCTSLEKKEALFNIDSKFIINSFGFLIPFNWDGSFWRFADLICGAYDLKNPQVELCYLRLKIFPNKILNKKFGIISIGSPLND